MKQIETALGEALKTVTRKRKTNRTIRVCDNCSTPLIWTFAFLYCERFCLNCGMKGGMLGTGTDVPTNRDLIFKKKLVNAIWGVIYGKKGLMPSGDFSRNNCKKCIDENCHRKHLTKTEVEWDEIARKYLKRFEGTITTK